MYPCPFAASRNDPNQSIEQDRYRAISPVDPVQQAGCARAKQCAAERDNMQFATMQTAAKDREQSAKATFQHPPGVMALIQMSSYQRSQRSIWRQRLPPQSCGRKAEAGSRLCGTFQLEDKEQPVDEDQTLVPQRSRIHPGSVGQRIDEADDRFTSLPAQVRGDPDLMQPCGLENGR